MKVTSTLLLTLLAVALPTYGQAYKCQQPDGSTQISSEPCSGGARTLKEVDAAPVPEEAREQAERDVERQRRQADKLEASRKADEAQERRDAEAQRKAAGLPSPAAVQQCLNTVSRMSLDAARRAELESGCALTGRVEPVYNETYQAPTYYYGGGYIRPYPPRPVPPPPPKSGKPVDLYKVPSAPRR